MHRLPCFRRRATVPQFHGLAIIPVAEGCSGGGKHGGRETWRRSTQSMMRKGLGRWPNSTIAGPKPMMPTRRCRLSPSDDLPGVAGAPSAARLDAAARRRSRHRTDRRVAGDHGLSACRGARYFGGDAGASGEEASLRRASPPAFGGPQPFTEAHFAGIVSAGVFASGHVGVEGLDELIPVCRRGGAIVLTVKNTLWDQGFAARVGELEANGVVAEEAPPYISMPGEAGTVPSRAGAAKTVTSLHP
jgi:hypothetical protein